MKKYSWLLISGIWFFFSCESNQSAKSSIDHAAEHKFEKFSAALITDLWKLYPGWASTQGYHRFDSVLVVPDENFHLKELTFAQVHLDSLKKIP